MLEAKYKLYIHAFYNLAIANHTMFAEGNSNLLNNVKIISNTFKTVCAVLWWGFYVFIQKMYDALSRYQQAIFY